MLRTGVPAPDKKEDFAGEGKTEVLIQQNYGPLMMTAYGPLVMTVVLLTVLAGDDGSTLILVFQNPLLVR